MTRHWSTCDNDIVISQIVPKDALFCNREHSSVRDEQAVEDYSMNESSTLPLQCDSVMYDDTCHQLVATCAYCGLREVIL
jgi:hypothetical protein